MVFAAPVMMMWLLMAAEQPIIAATIARLAEPERNLAAFGLAFSIALIIESPVIMLLMAGTALAHNGASYRMLLRFAAALAVAVTVVHLLVALTPAYELILARLVGAPEVVIEPGRRALVLMWGWSAAIAFRRLWQGVLIRHGRTTRVGLTTVVRVAVLVSVCVAGVALLDMPGAELGGLALNAAVIASAVVAFILVRPTVRSLRHDADAPEAVYAHGATDVPEAPNAPEHDEAPHALEAADAPDATEATDALEANDAAESTDASDTHEALTYSSLLSFYVPLALTSFILLGALPLVSVGLSRSPDAVVSLAVWPVLLGLLFVFRSPGYAFQEVAVALLDRPGAHRALLRFTLIAAVVLSALLALIALTPLADLWLSSVSGLSSQLVEAARLPLLLLVPVPALTMLAAWGRARFVKQKRTGVITQAVAVNLVVLAGVIVGGLLWLGADAPGAAIAAIALVASLVAENGWLRWRLREVPAPLT